MRVGNPPTLNFSESQSFVAEASGESRYFTGKSTVRKTRLDCAYDSNSGLEKTSLCNCMHGSHQSEPVKSMRMSLCPAPASATAASKLMGAAFVIGAATSACSCITSRVQLARTIRPAERSEER